MGPPMRPVPITPSVSPAIVCSCRASRSERAVVSTADSLRAADHDLPSRGLICSDCQPICQAVEFEGDSRALQTTQEVFQRCICQGRRLLLDPMANAWKHRGATKIG